MSSLDYLDLCRLCLVKDCVSTPIFGGEGDVRQIFLKIAACLPVKVAKEDKLPKKICNDCVYKVELCYDFWNTTANSEKQLLQWLGGSASETKQNYASDGRSSQSVLKSEGSSGNRLGGPAINNMGIGIMDNIGLGVPMMISSNNQQQISSVPMDTSSNSVQTSQAVPGPSSQTARENAANPTTQDEEEISTEDEENSDDDNDAEGLPVKEESEEDANSSRNIEPTTFVNVSLACDEAGPSGLQRQKIAEIPEMTIPQTVEGDPKSGDLREEGRFLYGKETIHMQPWHIVDLDGCLYYAFLPASHSTNVTEINKSSPDISIHEEADILEAGESNTTTMLEDDCRMVEEEEPVAQLRNLCVMKIKTKGRSIKDRENDEKGNESLTNDKVYACKDCNICFPVVELLRKHKIAVHDQAQRYKCKVCFKICRSLIAFKMHIALEHKASEEQLPGIEDLTYVCEFCNFESTNRSTLNSHINRKHPEEHRTYKKVSAKMTNESDEFSCDICEFKCPSNRRLKEHLERKHVSGYKYECEFCEKKFKVKGDMRLHVRFKHKEGPAVCDVCGKTCSNSNSLYVHQKWAHFKPKFECEICKRRMVTQENLDQHILLQHERRESFVCEECGKSFSENHRLKQHMMTHTGDRPYVCHICGKAFARRTAYRQHLLIHTGLRPYICDICGKAFTQKPGLICHRKSHPGVHPPLPVVHIEHIISEFMKKEKA
ncbi:uncharacterized protein [Prorops nasuta]|uniref:uncharacterized protein isoform X3 n=1 Tax=Prorops nasuta TaxID=863751 RepID=UPI0034CFF3B5